MNQTIAVIDYGMGNLHSVAKALEKVAPAATVIVTGEKEKILAADRIVFPGVGAIRDCMAEILRLHIDEVINTAIQTKPVLAICVGLQALMDRSEENHGVDCLSVFPGKVAFFGNDLHETSGEKLKVPHMGWNCVQQTVPHPLWQGIENGSRFYFVHSYYVEPKNSAQVAATTDYGHPFAVALQKPNLFAVQFHPEKSHTAGLQLLKNFTAWDGRA